MSLPPGTMLGPYEVLAPIEAGGMGSVYRGRDVRLARDVAVKVLPPGMVEDERAVERFLREARAAAALSHPNIVAIHDVGDAVVNVPGPFGGRETRVRFLVEEFVDGGSLRHRLKGGARPDLPTIAAWAAGLATLAERVGADPSFGLAAVEAVAPTVSAGAGETEIVQSTPRWVTVNVWPAIVTAACRSACLGLAATA